MKTLLVALIVLASACSSPQSAEIRFVHFEASDGGRSATAVFELVNHTEKTFVYQLQEGPEFSVMDMGNTAPVQSMSMRSEEYRTELLPGAEIELKCPLRGKAGPIRVMMPIWNPDGSAFLLFGPLTDISQVQVRRRSPLKNPVLIDHEP